MRQESIVPAGAQLEIVGDGRWIAATHEGPRGGGMRDSARMLEIIGTAEHPIVLRVVDASAAPLRAPVQQPARMNEAMRALDAPAPVSTGIRVDAADDPRASESAGEALLAEVPSGTRGSKRVLS
jgi:hypothetical protein